MYTSKITACQPLSDLTLLQVPIRLLELQAMKLGNVLNDLIAIIYLSILKKEGQKFFF